GELVDGAVDDLLHPIDAMARTTATTASRFMVAPLSEELAREVEAQIERVRIAALRNLAEGRARGVGEREREDMAAHALREPEGKLRSADRESADARRHLAQQERVRHDAEASADADESGVAFRQPLGGGVVDPERIDVHRENVSELARE